MSRATALIRFPDGTVKAAMYCGTSDVLWPRLFDDVEEAWDAYRDASSDDWYATFHPPAPLVDGEPVEIYSDYGGGHWWRGTATREYAIGPLDTWDDVPDGELHDGRPQWVIDFFGEDPWAFLDE